MYEHKFMKTYGNPLADIAIVRLLGEHEYEIDREVQWIEQQVLNVDWCLIVVSVKDWSFDMTPWGVSDEGLKGILSGKTGGAENTLRYILDEVIREFENKYHNINRKYILSGYSLAGLFSLWASYQTDRFYGIVAGSPSVWYPNWIDFINSKECMAKKVYISLGNKEHKTRNVLMSQVADNIQTQYGRLIDDGVDAYFELNPGNHFDDVTQRMVKGVAAIINMIIDLKRMAKEKE